MADKTQGPVVYTALIMPLSSHATFPKPQPPGGGGQPPTSGQPPRPDHTLPGDLPRPEHPIWYPLPPGAPVDPDYGVPEDGPHPDQGLPGSQPHPEHPIVLPPDAEGGWGPIYIWGGVPGARPPIAIPEPPSIPDAPPIEPKAIWSSATGWVVIYVPTGAHPTPSKSKK